MGKPGLSCVTAERIDKWCCEMWPVADASFVYMPVGRADAEMRTNKYKSKLDRCAAGWGTLTKKKIMEY